jgi:hypothetical protein
VQQAFPDFQQFFLESNKPYVDMDISRQQQARAKGVPSQILRDWEVTRRGGVGRPAWFSQFHQGDWQGPFKDQLQNSPSKLHDSERWRRTFAPQYIDASVLKRQCRDGKAEVNPIISTPAGSVRGLSPPPVAEPSVEVERSRAAKMVNQARLERKQHNVNRIQDQIKDQEEKMQQRDQANVENRILRRQDWVDRCYQAHMSIGNKYGKGYREPMVRHAFYAPTKLHYYPEGSYSQFDRKMPSVSPPPWTSQVQGSSLVPFAPSTRASAAQI